MFECTIESGLLSRFINGIVAVTKHAHLSSDERALCCFGVNPSNTIMVTARQCINHTGMMDNVPLNFGAILVTLPQDDTDIALHYGHHTLEMVFNRSRYKFYELGKCECTLREFPMKYIIEYVPINDMQSANNIITNINYRYGSSMCTAIRIEDGELALSDKDDNIHIGICDVDDTLKTEILISSTYLDSILSYMSEYIKGGLTLGINSPDTALSIFYDDDDFFIKYVVAPIVRDADV